MKRTSPPTQSHPTHSQQKASASSPQSPDSELPKSKISYKKNGHTDHIIDWLTNNVNDCIHLFSDNAQDASAEGRQLQTGKTAKLFYYCKIAAAVFEKDEDAQDNYAQDPDKYAKSVENHIQTCVSVAFIMNMQ